MPSGFGGESLLSRQPGSKRLLPVWPAAGPSGQLAHALSSLTGKSKIRLFSATCKHLQQAGDRLFRSVLSTPLNVKKVREAVQIHTIFTDDLDFLPVAKTRPASPGATGTGATSK
jgi:hypothetical protein